MNKDGAVYDIVYNPLKTELIKLAKKHIETELKDNKDLHIRYINESIDALNGVEL